MIRALLLALAPAVASALAPEDFAHGLTLNAEPDRVLLELKLPDEVFRQVTRSDLGDLRVFNAEGIAVPHALCQVPATGERAVGELPLRVFPLQQATVPSTDDGTRIELRTAGGTEVSVQEPVGDSTAPDALAVAAYIIDAREAQDPIRALRLNWASSDGASELRVRIETSEDLDRWRVLEEGTTLLRAESGSRQLERTRLPLPEGRYEYLRVERSDRGPALVLTEVTAETLGPAGEREPLWFEATPTPSAELGVFAYDSGRVAPVEAARLQWPEANMALELELNSRLRAEAPWTQAWRGEVYSVGDGAERRGNAPLRFTPRAHSFWEIRVRRGAESLTGQGLRLQLGYLPVQLRFLAQGSAPYTLAYGSRRVAPAQTASCTGLLPGVAAAELAAMTGSATLAAGLALGGAEALQPPPKPTPRRLIILWSILAAGVTLLLAMALSLFRKLRAPPEPPAT